MHHHLSGDAGSTTQRELCRRCTHRWLCPGLLRVPLFSREPSLLCPPPPSQGGHRPPQPHRQERSSPTLSEPRAFRPQVTGLGGLPLFRLRPYSPGHPVCRCGLPHHQGPGGLGSGEGQVLELNASDVWPSRPSLGFGRESASHVGCVCVSHTEQQHGSTFSPSERVPIFSRLTLTHASHQKRTRPSLTLEEDKTSGHAHSPQRPAWSGQGVGAELPPPLRRKPRTGH